MNFYYCTITQYIESKSSLADKIAAYDAIISSMESAILEATVSGHLSQYEMNDGQMVVRAQYRNINEMSKALVGLEGIRQRYINRYNGRVTVLRGGVIFKR